MKSAEVTFFCFEGRIYLVLFRQSSSFLFAGQKSEAAF